jgi:predicted nucleic acid-binding Zn finger protein
MLQNKDTKKISELKNGFTHRWLEPDFIIGTLQGFSFSSLCKSLNPIKLRGYSFKSIFSILICMPFVNQQTVHSLTNGIFKDHIQARKDVFYRLKNNPSVNWRYILWLFALKLLILVKKHSQDACEGLSCLIFDDSTVKKRGKTIENISRVWDHVTHSSVLGFKLLVMGYWDGTSFIPLDFSLHREKGKNKNKPYGLKKKALKKQFRKKRDSGSHGKARSCEAHESKIQSAVKMFRRAISHGLKIDYLLMDSWFTCEAFIEAVHKVKNQQVHLIGMYKIAKAKFMYQGKAYTYSQLNNTLGRPKRCRRLGLYYKQAQVTYKGYALTLFFSRQGTKGKWRVFLTTDTNLSFMRMIEIYQKRWTIEVFFKEAKQLLGLGQCQSNDFDGQIADTTISMIRYLLLTLKYRFDTYETKGELFAHVEQQALQYRLDERLWGLFQELMNVLSTIFDGVDEQEIMEQFLHNKKVNEILNRVFDTGPELTVAA